MLKGAVSVDRLGQACYCGGKPSRVPGAWLEWIPGDVAKQIGINPELLGLQLVVLPPFSSSLLLECPSVGRIGSGMGNGHVIAAVEAPRGDVNRRLCCLPKG